MTSVLDSAHHQGIASLTADQKAKKNITQTFLFLFIIEHDRQIHCRETIVIISSEWL